LQYPREDTTKEFKGKVAVITGGASGIGRGIAERCVREGMKVALFDIEEANLTKAETELKTLGGTVLGVRTDVSKRSDVELLARQALDAFGQVHLLFNNAGVGAGGAPWEATWNGWEWVIGVNLWGVIHGVKVFTPLMLAQNTECHIVNTSSAAGLIVGGGSAPYAATKHAVVALSESLYLTLQQRNSLVKSIGSLPRGCADQYRRRRASQAGGTTERSGHDDPGDPSPSGRIQGGHRGKHASSPSG
jgi:NAD(P)-dependent dehydrogenase (short-subunit alcohol dehydrogenase family)